MLLSEIVSESAPTRGPAWNLGGRSLESFNGIKIPDIIEGDFNFIVNQLTSLKGGPKEVEGGVYLMQNHLSSLQYGPTKVGDVFSCTDNFLTSLQYCPTTVGGDFICNDNKLSSLQYCPTEVRNFNCGTNQITSLQYCPTEVIGNFICNKNQLTSIEYCPTDIPGDFDCRQNSLTSIEHCPNKISGDFDFSFNPDITSLEGIHKLFKGGYIKGQISFSANEIQSHILGLLLIPKLRKVSELFLGKDLETAVKIINKHLAGDRDVIDCQQELIEAGLKAFAQL